MFPMPGSVIANIAVSRDGPSVGGLNPVAALHVLRLRWAEVDRGCRRRRPELGLPLELGRRADARPIDEVGSFNTMPWPPQPTHVS